MEISILRSKETSPHQKVMWIHIKRGGVIGFFRKDIFLHAHTKGCSVNWCVYTHNLKSCSKKIERLIENKLFNDFAFDELHGISANNKNIVSITGKKNHGKQR